MQSGRVATVQIAGATPQPARVVNTYGECSAGEIVLLIGSHGCLELACVAGNAAQRVGVPRLAEVCVNF